MTNLRQAYVFSATTLFLSWGFEALMISRGGVRVLGPLWVVGLMCIPGAIAMVMRYCHAGFGDAGLRIGRPHHYFQAVGTALLLGIMLAALAVAIDIRRPALLEPQALRQMGLVALSIAALGIAGAVGEELGWRGFLLPKLVHGGAAHPYLVTGVIWALWHLPLIAFGGFYETNHPWLIALVYGLGILGLNALICELRMRSGSVWVAALLHATHNFTFQLTIPALILTVPGSRASWWDMICGDTGLSVAALYAAAYYVFRRTSQSYGASNQPTTAS